MASRLKRLQDRRAALIKAMRDLSDVAEKDERSLTDEEQAKYDEHKAELTEVDDDLKRENELQQLERDLVGSMKPSHPADRYDSEPTDDARQAHAGQRKPKEQNWKSMGEFFQAVASASAASHGRGSIDPRLVQEATGLSEGVSSDGGFLVQTDFATELLRRTYENNQILGGGAGYGGPRRLPISANSNSIKINAIAETSRVDGSRYGGVQCYWKDEAGLKTATKPAFRQMELSLKKLIGLCYATDELLQDATALEAIIMDAFSEEMAFKVQDGFINGTGAGQMQGILPAACLVSVAKEAGQAPATIVKENIDKMYSRMWPRGVPNSVWLINQACYPQLFSLSQAVGTGGGPVYLPPGGLSSTPYGNLYGRPVVPIEQCAALGTVGDILFCDWSQYLFSDKGTLQSASSIHVKFIYDETVFRFVYRCDGQPAWNSALTPYKGTPTVGPFLGLATRA